MRTGSALFFYIWLSGWYAALGAPAAWKAGVAKIAITPEQSLWMAGYAARTKPSEGVAQTIWAKALALEDRRGRRAVLVTTDMLGFTARLSRAVAARVEKGHRIPRERILFNSSHTHSGPVIDRQLAVAYPLDDQGWAAVDAYTRQLEDKLVRVIGQALKDLAPSELRFGRTEVGFAENRRKAYGPGPVDHDVPVLTITGAGGKLRAVVFGYACHNTTLGGNFYQFHGDYAGEAQAWLEERHPGAVALFVMGCGADANPSPRGTPELARQHGRTLAEAVDAKLRQSLRPIGGPLEPAFRILRLRFASPPSREELESRLKSDNAYQRKHAQEMLKILDRDGRIPDRYPYPVQVWQFGSDLTLVALAGEVVADYSLRLKKELGPEKTWVAGYSNDVFAYIPSERVLKEGGYEGGGAMIYYVQPGPFAPGIEDAIIGAVHELAGRVRAAR